MPDTIQIRERHLTSDELYPHVDLRYGEDEISPAAAVTIASWYQAPGGTGRTLASFASGCEVDREELADDVSATIGEHYRDASPRDRRALDMLATFVLNFDRENA